MKTSNDEIISDFKFLLDEYMLSNEKMTKKAVEIKNRLKDIIIEYYLKLKNPQTNKVLLIEFATNILKQYSKEQMMLPRSTCDVSPLEEWLITRLYKMKLRNISD